MDDRVSHDREPFVRWQGISTAQLGYTVNLILGLAVATLGFLVALLLQASRRVNRVLCTPRTTGPGFIRDVRVALAKSFRHLSEFFRLTVAAIHLGTVVGKW